MAKKKKPVKRSAKQSKTLRPTVARYPWDKWFARRTITLTQSVDYWCEPHGMVSQIRNAASHREISVSVHLHSGVITVEVRR